MALVAVDLSVVFSKNSSCDENHPQVLAWVLPQCDEGCHGGSTPSLGGTQNPRMETVLVAHQDVVAQASEETTSQRADWHSGSMIFSGLWARLLEASGDCDEHATFEETPSQT